MSTEIKKEFVLIFKLLFRRSQPSASGAGYPLRYRRRGPMYLGHGFRPYGRSIGGTQQRAAWEPGASLPRDAQLGQDGFLVGAHESFLGALVQVVIA